MKTVRERAATFKLDEPISELFSRMRAVSKKVLVTLDPHPHYLMVSDKNLKFEFCGQSYLGNSKFPTTLYLLV